uniref:Otopetrin-2 n=1 Tax=Panagrellus redivivus TaxID=6233 RepID=A0A7E4VH64_PANRE
MPGGDPERAQHDPESPELSIDDIIHNRETLRRVTSLGSSSIYPLAEFPDRSWLEDASAVENFYSILTSMYALVLIVFAIVIELSQKFTPEEWLAETMFYTYMYGVGITFLIYFYLFVIHPAWYNRLVKLAAVKGWINTYKDRLIMLPCHSGEGAGSLYLRLGTLFFGSIGIVLFGLEIFMCLSNHSSCFVYQLTNLAIAGVFTFVQMHFLFCNSKIAITGNKNLAKLGTMHLFAVNIWTWLRFVLAKHNAKSSKGDESDDKVFAALVTFDHDNINPNLTVTVDASALHNLGKVTSFNYFGDFTSFLLTCIIEFSVVGAAIMFVLWRSIDRTPKCSSGKKKSTKVRIDCSSSSGGLFAGVLFLICSFVSIGIYSYFWQLADSKGATLVFRLADMALFCFALIGCCLGLYRMRLLQYAQIHSTNAEFLDELLLFIGLLGELIHCSTGILCWISTQRDEDRMETYMLFVLATRIVQVVLQSVFILLATRLRAISEYATHNKPGKQFVTFLLLANVSLFFFHTLEGMKSVFGDAMFSQKTKPYTLLISAVAPLTVFYRFHSSVCLAEIWKHTYSVKRLFTSNTSVVSFGDSGDEIRHYCHCTPPSRRRMGAGSQP